MMMRFSRLLILPIFATVTSGSLCRAEVGSASVGDASEATAEGIRNIILLIGDGMGPQQVGLLTLYARYAESSLAPGRVAAIERLLNEGVVGVMRVEPHGALVVDSAAAATQLATGQYAGSEMIGINYRGDRAETIIEAAHRLGKSAGLVTNTRITHATPAGFAAHQTNRNMENEIAVDMLENRVEVMLGGGLRNWVPAGVNDRESPTYAALTQLIGDAFPATSKRTDNRNLLLEARGAYQLAFDRAALAGATKAPLLGLFADSEMQDALLERAALADDQRRREPTPVEMTTKALELLDQDPDGFFLMVEGGQIDWAGHNNDAGTLLHELLRFDAVVRIVYEWAQKRDDTLVLVTGDHETGGFGFSYAGRPLPAPTTLEGDAFRGVPYAPNFNYAPPGSLDLLFAQEKSFYTMMLEFDALPEAEKTPERLVEIVNGASAAKITLDDAVAVLTRARNRNYVAGHPYMNTPTVPRIRDFEAFYVYGENLRMNLLGRRLARQQHVTWSAGTHTSTPVLIGAYGPPPAKRQFAGLLHATDVGQRMIELISRPSGAPPSTRTSSSSGALPSAHRAGEGG
jgi:alkaline phosphatase